jgi:hypothetical protein
MSFIHRDCSECENRFTLVADELSASSLQYLLRTAVTEWRCSSCRRSGPPSFVQRLFRRRPAEEDFPPAPASAAPGPARGDFWEQRARARGYVIPPRRW